MSENFYYECQNGSLWELRQTRYRHIKNHPHDVCAIANSHNELVSMYNRYFTSGGGVDWMIPNSWSLSNLRTFELDSVRHKFCGIVPMINVFLCEENMDVLKEELSECRVVRYYLTTMNNSRTLISVWGFGLK